MPRVERIRERGSNARKYADQIEGLIFDPQPHKAVAPSDPAGDRLSWNNVFEHYHNLAESAWRDSSRGDAREGKSPLLIVDAGSSRQYQVGIQSERSILGFRVVSVDLQLRQLEGPAEAYLRLLPTGIRREEESGSYIPKFAEQQRLLKVLPLLRRYRRTIVTIPVFGD